ncbi:MAG TPA: hypothetical protein VM370_09080 [Candidatus Thermoplasmatota archaeon]|nr:hypothetical protein [Candidatus Thermoplasmatota archaeon]
MDEDKGAGAPYKPKYTGFDEEAQKRAQATVDRAKESEGAKGEDANREYVDDGPAEYARRTKDIKRSK